MQRLAPSTRSMITRCWADYLGCAPEHFQSRRTLVVPHVGLGDYHGVFMFRFSAALVASVPPHLLPTLGPRLKHLAADQYRPGACVRAVGEAAVERVIGPAYYSYADATSLRPSTSQGVRSLTLDDAPLLERLRTACR